MMISEYELGQILRKMYDGAPQGERSTQVHLFGIKYADCLSDSDVDKKEVVKSSGLSEHYYTEIQKAMKLAKYVTLKKTGL